MLRQRSFGRSKDFSSPQSNPVSQSMVAGEQHYFCPKQVASAPCLVRASERGSVAAFARAWATGKGFRSATTDRHYSRSSDTRRFRNTSAIPEERLRTTKSRIQSGNKRFGEAA